MMNKCQILTVLFLLLSSLFLSAQNIFIKGNIIPSHLEPMIFEVPEPGEYGFKYFLGNKEKGYALTIEDAMNVDRLASFDLENTSAIFVRIEIEAPGFKKKSYNKEVDIVKGDGFIDIGTVKLIPNDMAEVELVESSKDRSHSGRQKLRVFFNNPHKKSFTIKETKLELMIPVSFTKAGGSNDGKPEKTIEISSDMLVKTGNKFQGNIIYDGDQEMRTRGEVNFFPLGKYILVELEILNRIELPAEEKVFIDLLMPKSFPVSEIKKLYNFYKSATNKKPKFDLKKSTIELTDFGSIRSINLTFKTIKKDEPPIYYEHSME